MAQYVRLGTVWMRNFGNVFLAKCKYCSCLHLRIYVKRSRINLTLVSLATKVAALTVWELNLETGEVVTPKTRSPPNTANDRAKFAAISRSRLLLSGSKETEDVKIRLIWQNIRIVKGHIYFSKLTLSAFHLCPWAAWRHSSLKTYYEMAKPTIIRWLR